MRHFLQASKTATSLLLFILLTGLMTTAYGQRVKWRMKSILFSDVYSNRSVNDVMKDHNGVIWIANNSGLYLYNGVDCRHYESLLNEAAQAPEVYQLAEDDQRHLWVLSSRGLIVLNPQRNNEVAASRLGIPDSIVQAPGFNFCRGKGADIFILSGHCIYLWRNGRLQKWGTYPRSAIKSRERAVLLFSEKQKQLYWYCPNEQGPDNKIVIYRSDNRIIDLWRSISDRPHNHTFLYTLTNAFADSVIVFTSLEARTKSIQVHYSNNYATYKRMAQDPFPGFSLQDIYSDYIAQSRPELDINNIGRVHIFRLSPSLLALSSTEGLLLLEEQKQFFQYLESTTGDRIRAIRQDSYGHLMFGTYTGTKYLDLQQNKLKRLSSSGFYAWNILPLPHFPDKFVVQGEDHTSILHFLQSTPGSVQITHSIDDLGDKTRRSINTCMAIDSVRNGIWHINNKDFLSFYDLNNHQNHIFLPKLQERGERTMRVNPMGVWIGGHHGLRLFSGFDFGNSTYQDLSLRLPERIRALSINVMYWISEQEVWIGTNSTGLFRYMLSDGRIEQYTAQEGLAENTVFSILGERGDSVLWLGTGNGLSRLDVKRRWFDNYYVEDGLSNNEFNTAAAHRAADGTMYMGGQNGINYFHPGTFQTDPTSLKEFALVTLKRTDKAEQLVVSPGDRIIITPDIQLAEFNFCSDDYLHSDRTTYRYRIRGLIDQWEYLSYRDKATFPLLPPGGYVLEVQVRSYRGMWLPPAEYILDVLPPWYATWWFRAILLLLLLALGLYGLYQLRMRHLRREFELRQQISHDLHDDLGSRIYLLRSLSHQIINPLNSEKEKSAQLIHFEAITKETFNTIRDFIWAFDPKQDDVNHLFSRMDDFAENYLSPIVPNVNIELPTLNDGVKVNPRLKHHLINIYQETLTNIVKHTQTETIEIGLSIERGTITIVIHNQHKGYKEGSQQENTAHKIGKDSLRNRLKEIGGTLDWMEPSTKQQVVIIKAPVE